MSIPRVGIVISHPIQHFCPQYASWARRSDLEVQVYFASRAGTVPYHDPNYGTAVRWEGLDLTAFPHEFLSESSASPNAFLDAPGLESRLDAFAPDALLLYGYAQRIQRRARKWARRRGVKLLMFSDSELRQQRGLATAAIKRLVLTRYLESFDAFLTTGDANEQYYRTYGIPDERMVRAPYPIDRDAFTAAAARSDELRDRVRKNLGIGPNEVMVAMVGKFVPWKRQSDAVEMLRHPGNENVVLALLGSGRDEAQLREMAKRVGEERVKFPGFVQPSELPAYYAATDVYIHTSEIEPHSVAVSEAVFMGCPVVISDRCGSYGPTDDVQAGRNGLVFRCRDVSALGSAIAFLARNIDTRYRFSAASKIIGFNAQSLSHGDGLRSALSLIGL